MNRRHGFGILLGVLVPLLWLGIADAAWAKGAHKRPRKLTHEVTLTVSASAYTGTAKQTDGHSSVGAWGDRLDQVKPGVRAIAVSPDLVAKGLTRNKRVRIEGLKGEFVVLDRTPAQWQNTIDIYLGDDVAAARRFGRKPVKISWTEPGPKPPVTLPLDQPQAGESATR